MDDMRPGVDDETIGIRAFKVRRAQAVERATQLIRHGMCDQWQELSSDEIEELEWILGEVWAYVARSDWGSLSFNRLTMIDVVRLITLGAQLQAHTRDAVDVLKDARAILEAE